MFTVKVNLNPSQILASRGLNKGGKIQQQFTNECYNHMEKYVPLLTGRLRSTVNINVDNLVFTMPYAAKQFYTNKGQSGGLRGSYWSKRMWNSEGDEILRQIASEVGGEVK